MCQELALKRRLTSTVNTLSYYINRALFTFSVYLSDIDSDHTHVGQNKPSQKP
jgi:hypothetical protein